MSALNLAEIRERVEKASPGPWYVESHGIMDEHRSRTIVIFGDSDEDDADAAFIACARSDIPALLDLISSLAALADTGDPASFGTTSGWWRDQIRALIDGEREHAESSSRGWPEGVSDGLTLACFYCGRVPVVDYNVDDKVWRSAVDDEARLGVVCIECLAERVPDVALSVTCVQIATPTATAVLEPVASYRWNVR